MKKVSIALLFLALLLVVLGAHWRREIAPAAPTRPLPFSVTADQLRPQSLPSKHPPAQAEMAETPKAIHLPVITLPAGCGSGCNALTHRLPRVV